MLFCFQSCDVLYLENKDETGVKYRLLKAHYCRRNHTATGLVLLTRIKLKKPSKRRREEFGSQDFLLWFLSALQLERCHAEEDGGQMRRKWCRRPR